MPIILAPKKRKEDHSKFEASLVYTVSSRLVKSY